MKNIYKHFLLVLIILILLMSVSVASNNDSTFKTKKVKDASKIVKSESSIQQKIDKNTEIKKTKKISINNSLNKKNSDDNTENNIIKKANVNTQEQSKEKRISKKENRNIKTGTSLKVINITEENIGEYFKLSDGLSLNMRMISANKDYEYDFYYFPSDMSYFDIDVTGSKFTNTSMKFVGKNNFIISNCGVTIENSFKNVSFENFNFNFDKYYNSNTFIKVGSPTTFCSLSNLNVTANVENPSSKAYILDFRSRCTLENSYIKTRLPEYGIDWYGGGDTIPQAVSLVIKSSNTIVKNNMFDITSCGNKSLEYYSSYGVYNEGYNFTFTNNTIFLTNNTGYAYGIVSRSHKAFISNNNITVLSHTYSAGINMEGGSVQDNVIKDNYINVTAGDGFAPWGNICVAYAALLLDYGYQGQTFNPLISDCKNNTYINNTIFGHAHQFYGFEIYGGSNTNISNNYINATGTTVMGVGAIGENVTIFNNIIIVEGEKNSTEGTADYIKAITAGIYSYMSVKGVIINNNSIISEKARGILIESSNNILVENNTVTTNNHDYTIEIDGSNNTIQYNALKGRNTKSIESIKDLGENNTIQYNHEEKSILSLNLPENSIKLDKINITTYLHDYHNNPISYQNITLFIENQTINLTTDLQGKTEISFIPKKAGYLTITAVFEGNEKYVRDIVTKKILINEIQHTNTTNTGNGSSNPNKNNTSSSNTTNTPTKLSTKITVNPVTATIGKSVTITATIKDQNNKPVSTGSAVFKVNGVKIGESKVTGGTAKVTYLVPNSWITTTPKLEVTYTGNNNYKSSTLTQSGLIKVNKGTAKLTLTTDKTSIKAGQKVTFTLKLTDANTKTGLTDTITIKVNGKSIKANVKNGKATFTYTVPRGTDAQTIKATTTYSSKYYNKATATSKFKVTKTTPTIKKTKITYKNKKTTIKATIKDATKKLLNKNVKVTVKVDGRTVLKNKVIKNGKISLSFKKALKKGNHKIVITSASTKAFNKATLKTIFKV